MKNLIFGLGLILSSASFAGTKHEGVNPLKNNATNLREWVSKNVVYPQHAFESKQEGTVYVSFTLSENGTQENIALAKGVHSCLDEAALLMVSEMPLDYLLSASEKFENGFIIPIRFDIR